ncbi:MAG: M3 family metallopeptidase [Bacteroidales bacterium]|nr:M3 family metallopeptidase [Bacteroidales bacterium]
MKRNLLIISLMALVLATGCKKKENMENPFFGEWNTPYNIPDFEKIKPEHYLPAFEEGIRQHEQEIEAIANNADEPTFENTIEALEYSGQLLNEVSSVFFNLSESNNTDEMEAIAEEITPKLTAHEDDIMLNEQLFSRVKAVYDQRESLGLNPEQMRLLEETYKNFVRNGANIPEEKRERFREINAQLASLTLRFGNNVLKATNQGQMVLSGKQWDITNIGLTDEQLAAAKELAMSEENMEARNQVIDNAHKADGSVENIEYPNPEDQYIFTLDIPTWEPFMQNCTNRTLREKMWKAYAERCAPGKEFDNSAIIDSIVNLRLERAQILGYESHAAYTLDDCLAKTPEAVYQCLMDLWTPALKKAKQERDEYQKMLTKDEPGAKLEPWDWRYYSEKLRKERYSIDDSEVRPYFSLDNVREGAFTVANKLYGITFRENKDLPKYDPETITYEVMEGDSVIAILYMDFFPRASKRSGAWMTNFREQYVDQEGNNVIPVISMVCNFSKPTKDAPALLNFDESETLFHEFGHCLHSILSRCHYRSLSGTNVPRDFVEMPSQIMENWCRHPEVMKEYARHYKTGEPIPDSLIAKIAAASTYGQGFINTELLAASLLDMDYHSIKQPTHITLPNFEDQAMGRIGLIPEIISRYKSPYFQHIFSGGYSAGYYAYTWTAILDADAFEAFRESGNLYNPVLAKKFRNILEHGNTVDPMTLYLEFRGKEPTAEALKRNRGLK